VLLDILYGPQAVDTVGAKRSEHHRHHCVGDMYDVEAITPQMIAYSAVVVCTDSILFYFISITYRHTRKARFALSSRRTWSYKEDDFDYRVFYRAIIMRLSDPSDPWVDQTIKWWNL
jgi:hypothetical protein